ncbi:MAG: hypothetical protein Q8P18_13960 [Pseudomonadota bacterium]|nr:hypothetical protein [Pseudomonadota bacterium]
MKILSPRSAAPELVTRLPPASTRTSATPATAASDGARFTQTGTLVSSLRREAAAYGVAGDIRPGVVEDMRREIAEGRLGTPEDLDRAVDAMLGEL